MQRVCGACGAAPRVMTHHAKALAVLRDATDPVPKAALDAVWDDAAQRERCLDALLDEGLAQVHLDGTFTL